MINKSTEERALNLIIEKGLDPIEAVKQALTEEIKLMDRFFKRFGHGLSETGQHVCDSMIERVYTKLKYK